MRVLIGLVLAVVLMPACLAAQEDPWVAAFRGTVDVEGGLMRLAAQRDGLIAEVLVDEGDRVAAGQVLARIDDSAALLQLRVAELELEQARQEAEIAALKLGQAEAEIARLLTMAAADAIPRKLVADAKNARDVSRAELKQSNVSLALSESRLDIARLEITAREVRSPVAGVILRSSARVGDAATTSTVTEMFLLAPDGDRVLKGLLDEQFVGKVRPGQQAVLTSERSADVALTGQVLRIAPIFATPGPGQQGQGTNGPDGVEILVRIDDEAARNLILGQRLVARIKP